MDQNNQKPKKDDYTIVIPPNKLKAKLGGGGVSKLSLQMANEVIEKFETVFIKKASMVIQELQEACNKIPTNQDEPIPTELRAFINNIAHELKGEGATFGHPLISDIAKSLNVYLQAHNALHLNAIILKAHVDALIVILKHGIKSKENEIAIELCARLDNIVQKSLEKLV